MQFTVEKKDEKKKGIVRIFLTGFIRIQGVLNWSAISFFGFLLGVPSVDVGSYVLPLFFFLVSTFCILAFTFAINNYYDIKTDKENPRRIHLNALASGRISKRTGMLLLAFFVIVPLVLSLLYSREVFVFCVLLLFWMGAYSTPPFRLKGRPGWDILWHFVAFVTLVLWGTYLIGTVTIMQIFVAVSFGLLGCFAQIDNHIRDYPFDKASGSRTFAVWIGLTKAQTALQVSFVTYVIFLIPLIVLYSFHSYLSVFLFCGGILLSVLFILLRKRTLVDSLYRVIYFFGGSIYINCLIYHLSNIM